METINENIRQLLEMLDHPESYSEQEIHDLIHRDEETLQTYRLMVGAKYACRHRHDNQEVDVDSAWQDFSKKFKERKEELAQPEPTPRGSRFSKVAASIIGIVLVSGIAFAAYQMTWTVQSTESALVGSQAKDVAVKEVQVVDTDSVPQPVVYDNVPLEKMLPEIAEHYGVTVTFANAEVGQLRFRFVWNPQTGLEQVLSDLNQFERINVTCKGKQITVQ